MNKVNKGGVHKKLLSRIDNLAWDLVAARFMEKMFAARDSSDYLIPIFFSFDSDLCDLLRSFPVKAVVIDRESDGVLSIPELDVRQYFKTEGCEDVVMDFFSNESIRDRASRRKVSNVEIMRRIRKEYKLLRTVLS